MNEIEEQRVLEALRAITGGLTVTEHDIIDAGTRMQHNLKAPPPHRNRALLAAAAVVVLIVGVVSFLAFTGDEKSQLGPADQPSPADTLQAALAADAYAPFEADFLAGTRPTAQDLAGIWLLRTPYSGTLVVNGGGDWSYGSLQKKFMGSSTLDDRTWTRIFDDGSCPMDGIGPLGRLPWTASIAGDGSLHLLFTGVTNQCTPADSYEVWDRLVPGPSPVLDYVRETSSDIVWTGTDEVEGLFINTETGHVLEVAPNGHYWYHDSVTGEEFTPSDEGTLVSDAGAGTIAGTCDGGSFSTTFEVGTTEAVADLLPSQTVVRIGTSGPACSPGIGTGGVWLKSV